MIKAVIDGNIKVQLKVIINIHINKITNQEGVQMIISDRFTADLRMEEYKKIADSYSHLSRKKKDEKNKKSGFSRLFNKSGA